MIRFLLLNSADPEADQKETNGISKEQNSGRLSKCLGKKIREEEGAKGIHRQLGKTWDKLIEETKRIRYDKEAGKELISKIGEGKEIVLLDQEPVAN